MTTRNTFAIPIQVYDCWAFTGYIIVLINPISWGFAILTARNTLDMPDFLQCIPLVCNLRERERERERGREGERERERKRERER